MAQIPLLAAAALLAAHLAAHVASAQPAKPAPSTAAPAQPAPGQAALPPVAAEPQRTTASFGDWVVRCDRTNPAIPVCEAALVLSAQGQTVAQVAIGRPSAAEGLRMTVLVPTNVTFAVQPRMLGAETDKDSMIPELAWRRCLPGGCIADAPMRDDVVKRLRARTEPARIVFQDGVGRDAGLPFSPRGLPQALDALAKDQPR